MRIAFFVHYFPPAKFAASINTFEIVKRLAGRGHEMIVFSQPTFTEGTVQRRSGGFERIRWPVNVKVYPSFGTTVPLSVTIPHFWNTFNALKRECDLVITQFHPFHCASYAGFFMKVLRGKPWLVKVQDLVLDPLIPSPLIEEIFTHACYRIFLEVLGKSADKMLVTTNELRSFLKEQGYDLDKSVVFPHGVDTKLFSPANHEQKYVSKKTFLYIGTMRPQYGLEYLIKALASLRRLRELELVLIGDGPERPYLMELTKKLDLGSKVTFHKFVSHDAIPDFIRNSYATLGPLRACLPNYYTIPTKILEYFACGKTTISTRVSEDILVNRRTGIVLKSTSVKDIVDSLLMLVEDEKLTASLGKNARQLIESNYTWEKTIDILEKEIKRFGS